MGATTNIQWADSTVNPTTGCDGCELHIPGRGGPCYAGILYEGRLSKSLPQLYAPTFTDVRMAPGRMTKAAALPDLAGVERPDKPWFGAGPRVIFIGDMGDVLSAAVSFDYLKSEVVDVVRSPKGRRHIWMMLTKQAGRLAMFAHWLATERGVEWPENLWAGTSITGKASLSRVASLLAMPPGVTLFLSLEPLREPVDLRRVRSDGYEIDCLKGRARGVVTRDIIPTARVALAIVGGESRQGGHEPHPFDLRWARDLIGQCRAEGVAAFVKQLGAKPHDGHGLGLRFDGSTRNYLGLNDPHGGDWGEWPDDIKVREFPNMAAADRSMARA